MQITRHFLTLRPTAPGQRGRRVHYRRCGSGPLLLLVHQSPRSSKEYEPLMRQWGAHFTCLAPDSPGFGQSDALPGTPEIEDFADALHEFLDAVGVLRCVAYGFHSGGVILIEALRRRPGRFEGIVAGGYPVWTQAEMDLFSARYLPPLVPQSFGEHLPWAWNRVLEQSWFFPWFDARDETRLSIAHADADKVHAMMMELLDAGDAYRAGYGAVMRAPAVIPAPDEPTAPVLICAYRADPMIAHIDRLPPLPESWHALKVDTPADQQDAARALLLLHAAAVAPVLAEDADEGFIEVDGGLIHWRGRKGADQMLLHTPATELSTPDTDAIAIDLPGHGLSDDAQDIVTAIEAAARMLGADSILWPAAPEGDPALLYPDVTPDRFGTHLMKAWAAARSEAIFRPWYAASAASAIPIRPDAINPEAIALRTRARLRAGAAAIRWHDILVRKGASA